jgi:hypothetical protein
MGKGPRKPPRGTDDPRLPAAVQLLERTGSHQFVLRYCEEGKAQGEPVIWAALARWNRHWEMGAATTPAEAVFRLCDEVIAGGQCEHCRRPTGFSPDLDPLPMDQFVCWYQWDPELRTFRRGCAGDEAVVTGARGAAR